MPQYRRIGHDFTCLFDSPPSPDHWEPVEEDKAKKPATPVETTKES